MKRILEMMVLLPVAGFALPVLIDSALKGAILMAVILLAVLMLRSASAALRHLVLVAAMVGLLVLPLLSLTLPGWRVLPAWAQTRAAVVVEPEREVVGAQVGSDFLPEALAAGLSAPAAIEEVGAPEKTAPRWVLLAVWAWLIGGVVLGLRLVLSQWALWRLSRSSSTCGDGDQLAMLDGLRSELGIGRRVELLVHPDRAMPMTWGIFKTRLLLPARSRDWQEGRLRAVLLHELAHVKRRDCLTQLLVRAVCMVHWFNPLVWVAARRIAAERERACDDLVLNSGIRASDYAEHLLRIATGYEDRPVAAAAALAMARKSRLEGRLTSILNQRTNRRTISRRVALCVAFALALLALPVAMMRAAVADGGDGEREESPQKSIEDLASEWAEETSAEEEPELLYQALSEEGDILYQALSEDGDLADQWFGKKEILLDPTKIRWRYRVQDPVHDSGMVSIAFAADHYLEKYKEHAAMQEFAGRRSVLQDRARELEKTHTPNQKPKHTDIFASDHALSEIEHRILDLGRLLDRGVGANALDQTFADFSVRSNAKQLEKQDLLDSGIGHKHPKVIGVQAEIDLLNQAPIELADDFVLRERVGFSMQELERKRKKFNGTSWTVPRSVGNVVLGFEVVPLKTKVSPIAKSFASALDEGQLKTKVSPAEAFFLGGGEDNPVMQRTFLGGATNLRGFEYSFDGAHPKAPRPATLRDPRFNHKWESIDDGKPKAKPAKPARPMQPGEVKLLVDPWGKKYKVILDSEENSQEPHREATAKLRLLQDQAIEASKTFGDGHPELIALRKQIAIQHIQLNREAPATYSIPEEMPPPPRSSDEPIRKLLNEKKLRLAELNGRGLGPKHPHVVRTETEIKALQRALQMGQPQREPAAAGGIGITITSSQDGRHFSVGSFLAGAPAGRGGELKPSDRIVAVAPQTKEKMIYLEGRKMDEVVKLIRGKIGDKVLLLIEREEDDAKAQRIVSLTREQLVLPTDRMGTNPPVLMGDDDGGIRAVPARPAIPRPATIDNPFSEPRLNLQPLSQKPQPPAAGQPVLLPLKCADVGEAKKAIDSLLGDSDRGRVVVDERTNSLIYIGDAATLKLVRTMLEWLDEPAKK